MRGNMIRPRPIKYTMLDINNITFTLLFKKLIELDITFLSILLNLKSVHILLVNLILIFNPTSKVSIKERTFSSSKIDGMGLIRILNGTLCTSMIFAV